MSDGNSKPESKAENAKQTALDNFIAEAVFPDPAAIFTSRASPLAEARDSAIIVLDTNALLVPYGIGSQTLSQIERTYSRLVREKRLVIPAQVAREFARNRATKLSELFQKLSRRRSTLAKFNQGTYPMLETLDEYKRVRRAEEQLDSMLGEYAASMAALIERVKAWEWNDPVSLLYGRLFTAENVVDTSVKRDQIHKDHLYRFLHKIPPGYKDGAKDDQGIGDFLIWLTIIEVGKAKASSVIFVSGEEKSDWFHRSEGQSLYPRFELVDEFRRASGGRSFHIIKFSELLEMFGASSEVVKEVRSEELTAAFVAPLTQRAPESKTAIESERAVAIWYRDNGYEVVATPAHEGYDYLVSKDGKTFGVDVIYVRSGRELSMRLLYRSARLSARSSGFPVTLVVVGEDDDVANRAEQTLRSRSISVPLVVGVITSEGRFRVVRES